MIARAILSQWSCRQVCFLPGRVALSLLLVNFMDDMGLPASSVLATRGCPGRCTFCYRIFGNRLRCRSGRNIAQEVKLLQERYGIKEICFYDDTFTAVRREVQAFCHALQEMRIDLTWSCFSRIDTFDAETFRLMKATGCHQVMYGVETYNPQILKNINKKVDHQAAAGVIRATKEIGLDVRAAFMLGNPGETEETLKEHIRFAIRLDPDLALFNITTPYPGTEMYDVIRKYGNIFANDDATVNVENEAILAPETAVNSTNGAAGSVYIGNNIFRGRALKAGDLGLAQFGDNIFGGVVQQAGMHGAHN